MLIVTLFVLHTPFVERKGMKIIHHKPHVIIHLSSHPFEQMAERNHHKWRNDFSTNGGTKSPQMAEKF